MPNRIPTHKHPMPQNRRPPSPYAGARWRRLRKLFLARNPKCRDCPAAAVHVDHILALKAGGAQYDVNNLQGFCRKCHSRKTEQAEGIFGRPPTGVPPTVHPGEQPIGPQDVVW
jgi:5-methylcytosine-specific restriction protein A